MAEYTSPLTLTDIYVYIYECAHIYMCVCMCVCVCVCAAEGVFSTVERGERYPPFWDIPSPYPRKDQHFSLTGVSLLRLRDCFQKQALLGPLYKCECALRQIFM